MVTARSACAPVCTKAATNKNTYLSSLALANMADMHPKARTSLRAALVETGLLRSKGLIDGKWLSAASGETFQVNDPATDTEFFSVASFGKADTKLAVSAAEKSFDAWRSKTMQVRFDDGERSALRRIT